MDALRIGIGIEFHSLGAVYENDLSSKEKRDLGTTNVVCATSKASDQPAHMRSLIRDFASPLNIL